GNIAYTIIGAPAVSSDGNYNGMNATDVSATNDDDEVNIPPAIGNSGGTANYTENAAPVVIDPGLTVSGNSLMSGATVTIGGYLANQDVLSFTPSGGITGTWNSTTGTLTLTGSASAAAYQTVFRSVRYVNSSDNPNTASRTITFSITDALSQSASGQRDVHIAAVNDAPTISFPAAQNATSNPFVFSSANGNAITIDDIDANGSTIEITLTATGGVL